LLHPALGDTDLHRWSILRPLVRASTHPRVFPVSMSRPTLYPSVIILE